MNDVVVVVLSKKISLEVFSEQRQVTRVRVLLQGNGPDQEITNEVPRGTHTPHGGGVSLYEQSMVRRNAVPTFF
jgi:hypothetical protein